MKKEMNQDDEGYTDAEIHAMESASDLLHNAQDNVTQANQVIEENMEEAYGLTDRISTIQEWLTETIGLLDGSLHKSSAKKSKINKAFLSWNVSGLQSALGDAEYAYMDWHDSGIPSNDDESRLYNEIESDIDELTDKINEYIGVLNDLMAGHEDDYEASTKKSKVTKAKGINKRLAKLGGFTKEDEDDDTDVEIEIETDDDDDVEIDEEEIAEKGCKDCKSRKSLITNKKRMKMKKGEDMPEDADDQQDQNEKGSGNAGSELPEDADDNQDQNEAGSGNAGSELPEDADDQQDIKESARKARLARMQRARNKSARKSTNRPPVRKFSMTPGGQPNQDSYNGRYQQAPMVRDAIDGHFGSKASKSFDEVEMMQERIDDLLKSKRNITGNNGVPKKLR